MWDDDKLGRKADAEDLLLFLQNVHAERARLHQDSGYVLNLDAPWGSGKTYFLNNLKTELIAQEQKVVYVNAWETDFADDPLIPLLNAILSELKTGNSNPSRALKKTAIGVLGVFAKHSVRAVAKKVGLDADGVATDMIALAADAGDAAVESISKAALEEFEQGLSAINDFKKKLATFVGKDDTKPIYILVDELDRCRPLYAISLLERIKHLFAVSNVIFIIATDSSQLKHSICAVYGVGFDSTAYLTRFFDRRYTFSEPSLTMLCGDFFAQSGIDSSQLRAPLGMDPKEYFSVFLENLNIDPRTGKQMFEMLHTFVLMWPFKEVKIQLVYLLPLIFAHQKNDKDLLNHLVQAHPNECREALGRLSFEVEGANHNRAITCNNLTEVLVPYLRVLGSGDNREFRTTVMSLANTQNATSMWIAGEFFAEQSLVSRYPDMDVRGGRFAFLYPDLIRKTKNIKAT